ncbi:serine protease inhibitor 88Ea-like [Temnothorax americanus]|uniref:serine protease inhibitor 88Ea-like n=1 Tax=Temnothorax americanus TaxID=1964332 RepID=UPI0040690FBE
MLTDARFKFALESLRKCMLMDPKNNIFFSPHLIYQNLLVMYFGASDDTENFLRKVLYIPDDVSKTTVELRYIEGEVNQFCYIMNGSENSYTCRIFSRLFVNERNMIYTDTMNLFSSGHHQVKEINFDNRPDHTRDFVNNTVKCLTQKYIQDVLPPDNINSNTDGILLNIIYCEGQLDPSFDLDTTPDISVSKKTRQKDKKDKKNKKDSTKKNFNNGKFEQLDAYIMEIPFKERKISMFFIFPSCYSEPVKGNISERDAIIQLIERLMTEEGSRELHKLLDEGIAQQTDMLFPIFNIEHDLEMHRLLEMLGIQEFMPSGTGLLHEFTCHAMRLGDAVHRIKIKMSKTRITAAATNVFFTSNNSSQRVENPNTVDIHFPCVCLIYDRTHRNILFCGVLLES